MSFNLYDFNTLDGLAATDWSAPLHFVGTGMANGYSLRWMSTAPDRRDWGSGVSGSHLAAEPATCLRELTGSLKLLDLRRVQSSAFSGDYFAKDRSYSCQILEANAAYLESGGYDGIIRYSQPILASGQYTEVIAITPAAIGKLGVSSVYALGQATRQLIVTRPDGSTFVPEILS
jgi:hypothetical protein